jgi:hypothetical protein
VQGKSLGGLLAARIPPPGPGQFFYLVYPGFDPEATLVVTGTPIVNDPRDPMHTFEVVPVVDGTPASDAVQKGLEAASGAVREAASRGGILVRILAPTVDTKPIGFMAQVLNVSLGTG